MRIQMNKEVILKPNCDIPASYKFKNCKEALYLVCPNCASELYWKWQYLIADMEYSKMISGEAEKKKYWDIVKDSEKSSNIEIMETHEQIGLREYEWQCEEILCPVCGGHLPEMANDNFRYYVTDYGVRDKGFHLHRFRLGNPFNEEEAYKILLRRRLEDNKNKAPELVKRFICSVNDTSSSDIQKNRGKGKQIKESIEDLKEYIHILLNLETSIESLSTWLSNLYAEHIETERYVCQYKLLPKYLIRIEINELEKEKNGLQQQLEKVKIMTIDTAESMFALPSEPVPPSEPTYKVPNLFNKRKTLDENAKLKTWYEEECIKHIKRMEEYHKKVSEKKKEFEIYKNNKMIELIENIDRIDEIIIDLCEKLENNNDSDCSESYPDYSVKKMVDKEILTTEKMLKEMIKCKNQLLDLDIIYKKYQEVGALAIFYEYLLSGRCNGLEGVGGAYNLYEQERQMNVVIHKLDDIKQSLEEIKESQYMIYSAIKEMNEDMNALGSSIKIAMKEIRSSLNCIEENTAITSYYSKVSAYYSKLTANYTRAIGFLVALN